LTLYDVSSKRGDFAAVQKKEKILIKNLYEFKGYNAQQFITEFSDKGRTKNRINGEVDKVGLGLHFNRQCDA